MTDSGIDGTSAREVRPSALPDDVLVVTSLSPVGVGIGAVDALGGEGEGLGQEALRLRLARLGLDVSHLDEHFVVLVLSLLATVPARRIKETLIEETLVSEGLKLSRRTARRTHCSARRKAAQSRVRIRGRTSVRWFARRGPGPLQRTAPPPMQCTIACAGIAVGHNAGEGRDTYSRFSLPRWQPR